MDLNRTPFEHSYPGNAKKLEEVKAIVATGERALPFELTNKKVDLPELQGEPEEIAKEKCRLAALEVRSEQFRNGQTVFDVMYCERGLTILGAHAGGRSCDVRGHLPLLQRPRWPTRCCPNSPTRSTAEQQ